MTEQYDISTSFPGITKNFLKITELSRQELGDLGLEGRGIRKAPVIENPVPQNMY
jgi:hypothetical protein